MTEKYFEWIATFNSLPDIKQFDGEKENLFSEVEKNKNDLRTFEIIAKDGEFYEVNFAKGEIDCNSKHSEKIKLKTSEKPELVYARRKQIRAETATGNVLETKVIHRIGLKTANDEIVVEAFPGLGTKEKNIKVKTKDSEKDITKIVK